jgi:hypothetical protein
MSYAWGRLPPERTERGVPRGGRAEAGFLLRKDAAAASRGDEDAERRALGRRTSIEGRKADLQGATSDLRTLLGRFLELKSHLVGLLGQAQCQASGLVAALAFAHTLLVRAEEERGRAGSLSANAAALRTALHSAAKEADRASQDLLRNAQSQHGARLDLAAVEGQMHALQSIIQAILAEIATLLSQSRS